MPVQLTHDSELGEVVLWAIEHDGIIEERWKQQYEFNERRIAAEAELKVRLDSIEAKMTKLFIFAGCGAFLGSFAIDLGKMLLT